MFLDINVPISLVNATNSYQSNRMVILVVSSVFPDSSSGFGGRGGGKVVLFCLNHHSCSLHFDKTCSIPFVAMF